MIIKFEWEEIWNNQEPHAEEYDEATYRAQVIGGWLVRHLNACDHFSEKGNNDQYWMERRSSMVFIPDPEHRWEVE